MHPCIYIVNLFEFYIVHVQLSNCVHSAAHSGMVRDQALHALGDGSPTHLEERIVEEVEKLYNDPYPDVKKKARRMLNSYRRTGKWNVL